MSRKPKLSYVQQKWSEFRDKLNTERYNLLVEVLNTLAIPREVTVNDMFVYSEKDIVNCKRDLLLLIQSIHDEIPVVDSGEEY